MRIGMPSIVPTWNAHRDPGAVDAVFGLAPTSLIGEDHRGGGTTWPPRNEVIVKLIPELKSFFTFQNYGKRPPIEGVVVHTIRRFAEDGGSMTELSRFVGGDSAVFPGFTLAQINYSTLEPQVLKAFHLHHRQTDVWFVPPEDRVVLVLVDVRAGSPTEKTFTKMILGDGQSLLVRIPPGVAHGCRNLSGKPAHIVYMTDVHFSAEPGVTDEGRLPWDLVGADVWEPSKD
jgi:dTDP-4-dehydrorhamnose 3,5-epimerase